MSHSLRVSEDPIVLHSQSIALPIASPRAPARYFFLKRCIDLAICLPALVICLPLMLLVALFIKADSLGPVLFIQERVGASTSFKNGDRKTTNYLFRMYKFRTMFHNAAEGCHRDFVQAYIANDRVRMAELQKGSVEECKQYKLVGDPRITRAGRFLRKTSLDELPQLLNVVKGDMSLVGPRPPIPYEVEMYAPWHHQRLQARPGITGYWQVTARSSVDFDEMVRLDIEYINRQSLWLDVKILVLTPFIVLRGEGAV